MKKNTNENTIMTPGIKKMIIIAIIIGGMAIFIAIIGNSPLGKALSSLLGGFAGVAAAVGHQLETCNKVGYFNLKKGCFVGFFTVFAGLSYLAIQIIKKVANPSTRDPITNKLAAETGKGYIETAESVLKEINLDVKLLDKNGKEVEVSSKVKKAALEKALSKKLINKYQEVIQKQSKTAEARNAELRETHDVWTDREAKINKGFEEIREDMTEEELREEKERAEKDIKDVDKLTEEMIPDTPDPITRLVPI